MAMRKILLSLCLFSAASASADDKIMGGFIVAPLVADGYSCQGVIIAPKDIIIGSCRYVTGSYIVTINPCSLTGIESVKNPKANAYYNLQDNKLSVMLPARIHSLDGKLIADVKANSNIYLGALPKIFIIRFKDGASFKVFTKQR